MNIIITGTSRGIGFELVKEFAKNGNHSIFAISRNSTKLNDLKDACIKINSSCTIHSLAHDITVEHDLNKIVTYINNNCQTVDILINNAGFLINKPFESFAFTDIEQMYKTNVFAPMQLIQNLIPLLKKSSIAHTVNISSMGGFQGTAKFPGLAPYSSSKAAIASLTECLAEEYKETNLKFNCLALGAVATEMLAEAFPGYKAPTTAFQMADYITNFALNGCKIFNGKILPVSNTTP